MLEAPVRERVERKLEKSGRITPRMVLEAYEETGCGVAFGIYYDDGRACAVGALLIQAGFDLWTFSDDEELAEFFNRIADAAGPEYLAGFVAGFDTRTLFATYYDGGGTGFRDGQRARRFVLARHRDAG